MVKIQSLSGYSLQTAVSHKGSAKSFECLKNEIISNPYYKKMHQEVDLHEVNINLAAKIFSEERLLKNNRFMCTINALLNKACWKDIAQTLLNLLNQFLAEPKLAENKIFNNELGLMLCSANTDTKFEQLVDYTKALEEGYEKINSSKSNIEDKFELNMTVIMAAIDTLGLSLFTQSYNTTLKKVISLASNIYNLKNTLSEEDYQALLLKINPQKTDKYQELETELRLLKKDYPRVQQLNDPVILKELQDNINTKTKQIRTLSTEEKITAPDVIFNKIQVLDSIVRHDKNDTKTFLELIKPPTKENEKAWIDKIHEYIYKVLGFSFNNRVSKLLKLNESKYLDKVLYNDFSINYLLEDILNLLYKNPEASIQEALDTLDANIKTKEIFEKYGIDYEKWCSVNEKSIVKRKNFSVHKADMNDIKHSLFLGNHASCCTAIGSSLYDYSATGYIKNKMFAAIEVLDGDKPIGNTMCYLAKVDDKISLIMDNIELKGEYKDNEDIKDAIIEYAKIFCDNIGQPDLPIYAAVTSHKIDLKEFEKSPHTMQILGLSGDDVYLDFIKTTRIIDKEIDDYLWLYKIR